MSYRNLATLNAIFVSCLCSPVMQAQMYPPITSLERGADLAVVATVSQILDAGGVPGGNVTLQLTVSQALKGTLTSTTLIASVPARSGGMAAITFPTSLAGQPAIWFLQLAGNGYQILPRKQRGYSPEELF